MGWRVRLFIADAYDRVSFYVAEASYDEAKHYLAELVPPPGGYPKRGGFRDRKCISFYSSRWPALQIYHVMDIRVDSKGMTNNMGSGSI